MTHPPTNPLSRTRRRRVRRCRGLLEGAKVKEIHALRKENKSIRSIAETLGISRNTVRKYLRTPGLPEPQPRPPRPSKLNPYREYIKRRMLQDGVTNSHVLLRELRAMGSTGGRTILKDFMKPLRPPQPAPAALRFETGPGEQAQVDLTPITLVRPDGTTQQVWAFAMVLDWSRAGDVEVIAKADLPSFQRCHVHAFEHFGGVPRRLLYDNTKLVVLGRDPNGPPMWTPRFLDCALRMGFDPRLCQPYRAQTKGKVERFLRYVQDTFVPSACLSDRDGHHRQAVLWCLHVADQRIHGTTHERPAGRLKQERLLLRPMPPAERIAPLAGKPQGGPGRLCHLAGQRLRGAVDVRRPGGPDPGDRGAGGDLGRLPAHCGASPGPCARPALRVARAVGRPAQPDPAPPACSGHRPGARRGRRGAAPFGLRGAGRGGGRPWSPLSRPAITSKASGWTVPPRCWTSASSRRRPGRSPTPSFWRTSGPSRRRPAGSAT